jgi:hypothetical protein
MQKENNSETSSSDVDDFLDRVVDFDEHCQAMGAAEGEQIAKEQARAEGARLGHQLGRQLGLELGFYEGCLWVWRDFHCADSGDSGSRRRRSKCVADALELIGALRCDPLNEQLQDQVDRVRGKFRQAKSLMGDAARSIANDAWKIEEQQRVDTSSSSSAASSSSEITLASTATSVPASSAISF